MEMQQHFSLKFPVWQYLTQPLFQDDFRFRLSPKNFWKDYQVDFLEHCFMITSESSNPS